MLPRMESTTTHRGGCHCGKVRFEVELDLSKPVISCNCSICSRAGTLLAFAPPERFRLTSGEDALSEYRFHKEVIAHLFCSTCGIKSFARGTRPDGAKMVAINVRCLDDVDVGALTVQAFDGRRSM